MGRKLSLGLLLHGSYFVMIRSLSIIQRSTCRLQAPQRHSIPSKIACFSTSKTTPPDDDPLEKVPSQYAKRYRLSGSTSTNSKSGVTIKADTGHELSTDVPKKLGGQDLAPQPVETLLAALIGCTQATALFVGRNIKPERVLIERMEFDLEAVRDERGALTLPIDETPGIPSRLQQIVGTVDVYAKKEIPDDVLHMLRDQTEVRCPVANMMIASGCEMLVEWRDGNRKA